MRKGHCKGSMKERHAYQGSYIADVLQTDKNAMIHMSIGFQLQKHDGFAYQMGPSIFNNKAAPACARYATR